MTDSIAAQVAALPKKPTPELRQMWRQLFAKEPPGFSRNYLISRLAYRIQELGLRRAQGRDPRQARRTRRRAGSESSAEASGQRAGRRHNVGPRMARRRAQGHGACRRLRVGGPPIPEPERSRTRDQRNEVEWLALLRDEA
jgi:Protein of unknown function (DUF2924)